MEKGIKVLSLFDGISCGQIALNKANIKVDKYFASEIDKKAIEVTQYNYPQTVQLGNVEDIDFSAIGDIDLLIGGSPCTNFSVAGRLEGMVTKSGEVLDSLDKYLELKNKGFEFKGQSYLFWEFIRALRELKPKYFLLENVKMRKEWEDLISKELGVKPVIINSNLVSAQNRVRLYWTNIPDVTIPDDKGLSLRDAIEEDANEEFLLDKNQFDRASYLKGAKKIQREKNGFKYNYSEGAMAFPNDLDKKANCLLAAGQPISRSSTYIETKKGVRKITPTEAEKLQTVPKNYTNVQGVSDSKRYSLLGNGWTVDVIAHILKNL